MSKKQDLEALYDTVAQIYLKNMEFLSKSHIELFKRIKEFEALGIENYFLDFQNNHFELLDINKNKTYNCDPFYDAKKRCENIKDQPIFNLIKDNCINEFVSYKNSLSAYKFINEYIKEASNILSYKKFIFLGTLLGVHINDLHKNLGSEVYLIIEDNIEIFRLSLFLTDYEEVERNSKIFFCINEKQDNKELISKEFLNYKYEFNSKIPFELANEASIDNIEFLTQIFIKNDPLNYPFSEYLVSLNRSFKYFNKYKKHLQLNNNHSILNKPVLFLGAGPSLADNIEWVYLNQDSFIIICAAGALKRCELLDIVPDVILSVDGQYKQVIRQYDVQEKYYKNSMIITSIKTNEKVIEKIESKNLFFMQDNLEIFSKCGIFTGVTVGDIGLDLLLRLGAKEIYMLGFDASISKRGKTHDGTHTSKKIRNEKTDLIKNNKVDTKNNLFEVEGNFRKTVLTFILYKQMINSINLILKDANAKIYNLSDGASFKKAKALRAKDINTKIFPYMNKEELREGLEKDLNRLVLQNLSSKDKADIKVEQKVLKKLKVLNEINLDKKFKIASSSYKNSISIQILNQFFKLIKPYSFSFKEKENFIKQYQLILKYLEETYTYPFL